MREDQFQVTVDLLKMIEYNTSVVKLEIERKAPISLSTSSNTPQSLPILSFLDEALEQIQKTFFDKLNAKTSWGRNEIKQAFTESVKSVRTPIVEEDLPWQR